MRIERLTIHAFRSFGSKCGPIDLDAPLAVVWGPNSGGKTSFSEALEFLLTGDIARRELLSSTKDEFAGALRNVHAADEEPTFVEATFVEASSRHVVRRTLTRDFEKRKSCESVLLIDDAEADEHELEVIGFRLAEPPMAAPVLMQHTLGYLFSASPKDRAQYFKALLEVGDLDDLRSRMRELKAPTPDFSDSTQEHLERCLGLEAFSGDDFAGLLRGVPSLRDLAVVFMAKARQLLLSSGEEPPKALEPSLQRVEAVATEKSSKTFPLDGLRREERELIAWSDVAQEAVLLQQEHLDVLEAADDETKRLAGLFREVLARSRHESS